MAGEHKGGKKNRKFGRNRNRDPAMKRYKAESRAEKNRIRRLKRHFKKHPNDLSAHAALGYGKLFQT